MIFVLMLLFITSVLAFCFMFIFSILEFEFIPILMLFLWLLTWILLYIVFSAYVKKYPKNCISEYEKFHIHKQSKGEIVVNAKKEHGIVYLSSGNTNVKINLKGFIFKKTYIIAYLNRQIKYKCKNISIKDFFKTRIYLDNYKNENIILKIHNKNVYILKKGVLKQSFLAQLISQSIYIKKFIFMRTAIIFINRKINNLNEKKFLNGEF